MKGKIHVGLLIFVALIVGIGSGYYLGQQKGYSLGKKDGFSKGHDEGFNAGMVVAGQTADNEDSVAQSDYDDLVEKYNNLVRQYNASLNTSISCFSNTYGLSSQYTSTNCY